MTDTETIDLETLSLEIAKTISKRDKHHTHDASDPMDITIVETLHKIGNPDGSLPAARPHILAMVHKGEITVCSIFNNAPPVYLSDVTEHNFDKWHTSKADAGKVRDRFSIAPKTALSEPLPTFTRRALVSFIDSELSRLPRDARIALEDSIGTFRGNAICSAGEYLEVLEAAIKRQSEDFFTVGEAAQILFEHRPDIDIAKMVARLRDASIGGRRIVRNSDDRLPASPDATFREFMDLVCVSDLNDWLDEQRVGYRFPEPAKTTMSVVLMQAGDGDLPRRKTKKTWLDVSLDYMLSVLGSGQFSTAKLFYSELLKRAGEGSPFDRGEGSNRGSLFVREINEPLSLKTVQNRWADIRAGNKKH